MSTDQAYHVVTMVLAVGSVGGPIFFGFLVFRLMQVFVSKDTFVSYKERADQDRNEIKTTLDRIEGQVMELLQRTAGERTRS